MEPAAYKLTIKQSLVREGPGPKYPTVNAFPKGLPINTIIGIDMVDGYWGRIVGTTWWIYIRFAKR